MKKLSFRKFMAVFSTCALLTVFVPLVQAETVDAGLTVEDVLSVGLFDETYLEDNQLLALTDGYAEDPYKVEFSTQSGQKALHVFTSPVKYMDNEGKPRFIDSRFKEVGFNLFSADSWHYDWVNTANAFKLYVSSAADRGVKLVGDGFSITQKTDNAVGNLLGTASGGRVSLGGTARQYTYENTATGYIGKVAVQDAATQSVTLQLEGKNIDRFEIVDNAVILYATDGDTVTYNAPVLTDDNKMAYTVNVSAEQQGENYSITYAWDTNTANSLNLQYEVTVREGAETEAYSITSTELGSEVVNGTAYYAAYVSSAYPDTTQLFNDGYLKLGTSTTVMGYCASRIYLRFSMNNVSFTSSQVIGAQLMLLPAETISEPTPFQAEIYRVPTPWTANQITWLNQPNCTEKISTTNINAMTYRGWVPFSADDLVRSWIAGVDNASNNYGLMVKERTDGAKGGSYYGRNFFHITNDGLCPFLRIVYDDTLPEEENGIGIKDGATYYIKNKRSGKYLTATGTAANSAVQQATYTGAANQKWKVTQYNATRNSFRLVPQNATGMSLSKTSNGPVLKATTTTLSANQEFKFLRNWDGTYHIVGRSLFLEGLFVNDTDNSIHFEDYETTLGYWDDWTLEKVGQGTANVYGTNQYFCNEASTTMGSALSTLGYGVNTNVSETAAEAINTLSSSNVWIVDGHGSVICIQFENGLYVVDERAKEGIAYASDLPGNSLAGVDLIVLATCGGFTYNIKSDASTLSLATTLYNKGAHLVLSYTCETTTFCDIWVQKMLEYCDQGKTISEAASMADAYIYTTYSPNTSANFIERVVDPSQTGTTSVLDYNYAGATQYIIMGDKNARLDN